ncbi:MAG: acetamidase/formamidase family protein [Xanthobacteraceae bacterium]
MQGSPNIRPLAFSSEDYPQRQRGGRWNEALGQVGLLAATGSGEADFYGSIRTIATPGGTMLARISTSPQRLHVESRRIGGSIRILQHLDGQGIIFDGATRREPRGGDLVIVPDGRSLTIEYTTPFRLLFVAMSREATQSRAWLANSDRITCVSGGTGAGRLLSGLLMAAAETIEDLRTSELRPLDATLLEFLSTNVLKADDGEPRMPDSTTSQAAILQRTLRAIDSRLSDPELSHMDIARDLGLSTRYVQKLLTGAGESFTSYLRNQRLERCRTDLADPANEHLTISEICFRWGFNDAAHFSKVFRDRFGASPKNYRQDQSDASSRVSRKDIQRGWPKQALDAGLRSDSAVPVTPDERAPDTQAPEAALEQPNTPYLAANSKTVHWGYFSRNLTPTLVVDSGDVVTVEVLTQHANDDSERMVRYDPGAESVFHWTPTEKAVDRRGAGPMDASVYGRGAGEGFGVHIMTGPIAIREAQPGDVLEVRILDVLPRPSRNPAYLGRCFGSNAAAWWGLHYKELLTEPKPREVVTIYEFDLGRSKSCAHAVYSYRWQPQRDPYGVVHETIDYPGVPVDPATIEKKYGVLDGVEIPVRPHFGVIGVAPREDGLVDSIPPAYFGGNLDNWRVGKGAKVFLPVAVPGGLLSIGDPHASQGDSELCGTAIECSLTGIFQLIVHKKGEFVGRPFADLNYPLIETPDEWVLMGFSHPNYLAEFGEKAQSKIYDRSSLDLAMKDAFRKVRRFLMATRGLTEDEAISLISVAIDFGISQVVDGNWAVHAIVRKDLFKTGGG